MTPYTSRRLITASGWLALAASVGSAVADEAWWGLLPAAILLTAGLIASRELGTTLVARVGKASLVAAVLLLLAATAAGLVTTASDGFEPGWVGWLTNASGITVVIAAAVLGIGVMGRRPGTGILVAAGLPVGLALDWVMGQVLVAGFFLSGAGFYIGMILFAIGLVRLGRHGLAATTSPTATTAPRRRRYRSGAYAGTL